MRCDSAAWALVAGDMGAHVGTTGLLAKRNAAKKSGARTARSPHRAKCRLTQARAGATRCASGKLIVRNWFPGFQSYRNARLKERRPHESFDYPRLRLRPRLD